MFIASKRDETFSSHAYLFLCQEHFSSVLETGKTKTVTYILFTQPPQRGFVLCTFTQHKGVLSKCTEHNNTNLLTKSSLGGHALLITQQIITLPPAKEARKNNREQGISPERGTHCVGCRARIRAQLVVGRSSTLRRATEVL
jgi:hypothetical protein